MYAKLHPTPLSHVVPSMDAIGWGETRKCQQKLVNRDVMIVQGDQRAAAPHYCGPVPGNHKWLYYTHNSDHVCTYVGMEW